MPRFVILEHQYQGVHWDFMLEVHGRLRTWRLRAAPAEGQQTEATPLPDHRLAYLDYEGELSRGRGRVRRWDRGEYGWLRDQQDAVEVTLSGQRLRGRAYLRTEGSGNWSFRFETPETARDVAKGPSREP